MIVNLDRFFPPRTGLGLAFVLLVMLPAIGLMCVAFLAAVIWSLGLL